MTATVERPTAGTLSRLPLSSIRSDIEERTGASGIGFQIEERTGASGIGFQIERAGASGTGFQIEERTGASGIGLNRIPDAHVCFKQECDHVGCG